MLKAFSVAGYLVMAGGLLGLIYTRSLFSTSPFVLIVQVLAAALMGWARMTFGRRSFHLAANPTAGGLVTEGPYRWIRHPIYAAACLFASAGALAHLSLTSTLWIGFVWAGAVGRMFCEERLLAARFPEYRGYAASTWRIIPFLF